MRIFIIHSMGMSDRAIEYGRKLEELGNEIYVPILDTDQTASVSEILRNNLNGVKWADEVHVIWDLSSQGTIFDMGCAYALGKPIFILETKRNHWTKFILKNIGKYLFE